MQNKIMDNFEMLLNEDSQSGEYKRRSKRKSQPVTYRELILQDPAWREMIFDVNKSVKDSLANMVSSYSEKKRKLDAGYYDVTERKKILLLAPHLSFLEDMLKKRKPSRPTSNIVHVDDGDTDSENEDTEVFNIVNNNVKNNLLPYTSSQTIKYIKKNDQLCKSFEKNPKEQQTFKTIESQNKNIFNTDEFDDIDHFFKSLSLSIKKLPSKGISEAKLKMLSSFMEIENKYTNQPFTFPK
uniref:BESS domain-containing protein n=1 Tax=Schizaphis graminum TaxID=13262 RepID=A0A2S2NC41_SCHGA